MAFLFSFMCLSVPKSAEAAITVQQPFPVSTTTSGTAGSGFYKGTAFPGATSVGTFTVNAGTDRVLVVAVTTAISAAATQTCTVTYNSVSMTQAIGDGTTSARQHSYLFYLPMGTSASAGSAIRPVVTVTGGTAQICVVTTAVYAGVDQATVIRQAKSYNGGTSTTTTVGPFAAPLLAITAGDRAVEVVQLARTASGTARTISTWATGWSVTSDMTGTYGAYNQVNGTTIATNTYIRGNTTVTAGTNSQHTASGTTLKSMKAMVLMPSGITVATGSAVTNKTVYAGDAETVVDAFSMTGTGTVTGITVTGNANTTATNVEYVKIYRKVGANLTALEGADVPIGTGYFPSPATVSVNEPVSGTQNYIVVYKIASTAVANGTTITLTGAVSALTPAAAALADTGQTLTINATTTLGTGVEPPTARLWTASAPVNMDAFTLKHNGTATDDDAISNVTVTLSPQYISGGSGGTQSKIKLVEIVSADGNTVYGSANAAISGDNWSITTSGLVATSTLTTYYVRVRTADAILPSTFDTSGTPTGYYVFYGTITAANHGQSGSKLDVNDGTSQSLEIDMELPDGPAGVTSSTGTAPGTIDLSWDGGTDGSGGTLHPTTPYLVRRGATLPDPYCVDGDVVTLSPANQTSKTLTDTGLIDTNATPYYYRVCVMDAQGNISYGVDTVANSKVRDICDRQPDISLVYADGTPGGVDTNMQLIKSTVSSPFRLSLTNKDVGTCPDVALTVQLANVVGNDSHFAKKIDGKSFPQTFVLGNGATASPVSKTVNIEVTGIESAGVNQLEQYKFGVTVSGAGHTGLPFTTPSVIGLLNDMPPIVHNSANMGKYQYGSWGQTYTCATCHSNSTTNIKGVYQVISTPIGRRNVVFNKTSSVVSDYVGVYSNDQRAVNNVSNNVCSVCHHRTRQHQYSASKASLNNGELGVAGPGADEKYVTDHHNSRDCVKCHTHNTAFKSIYGQCGDCHGFKATGYSPVSKATMVKDGTNALGPEPINYGAHARHNTAKITCEACHYGTNHGTLTTAWTGDNAIQMGFKVDSNTYPNFNTGASVLGGTFTGTQYLNKGEVGQNNGFVWQTDANTQLFELPDYNPRCTTYCHGNWQNNEGSNTNPLWAANNQVVCGSCHYATGTTAPASGSHTKHASSVGAGLGIACTKCHSTYANYTGSAHVNGNVEWKFSSDPTVAGGTYKGSNSGSTGGLAPSDAASYGTCTNLYCHSTVQGAGGTGAPTYKSATWGEAPFAQCGRCHAYPNTTGSHANHENQDFAFDCHVCHKTGGTTTPTNHANGQIDFKFNGLGANTRYKNVSSGTILPGQGYGTCSNSNCHGQFTRAWGTPSSGIPLCEKCHGSATSDRGFYSTRGPSGTLSIYSSGVGLHDIHVQNPNSPRKTAFARFTSYAAPMHCNQCHLVPTGPFTPEHIDTALPAEAHFSHISSIARSKAVYGNLSVPTYSNASKVCSNVYCHGAGMDSNTASGKYAGTTPMTRQNPGWYTPTLTGNGANDCTKCHSYPPPAPNASYTHYNVQANGCSECHQHLNADGYSFNNKSLHINGVVDGGCDKCHGYPPINNIVGDHEGLATPAQNALSGGAGAHEKHMGLPLIAADKCNACHNGYNKIMRQDYSGYLEMGFNGFGGQVNNGTFTGYSNAGLRPRWKSTSNGTIVATSTTQAAVCSNLYCHGGGSTAPGLVRPALGGGANTSPNWEVPAVCGDCHGIDSANAPTGGSHAKHAAANPSLACSSCHGPTADNGTHVNAAVSWKLDRSNFIIGTNATYNNMSSGSLPGLAPRGIATAGDDYRNCNNIYCHSSVQSSTGSGFFGVTYGSPKWGAAGSVTCGSCHKNMATDGSPSGSHLKHANTTSGMGVPCGYCHQDAGFGFAAMHADGSVFVNFTSYVGGTYNVAGGTAINGGIQKEAGSAAFGTCSATFCHGTNPSPQWGVAGTQCNSCHGAKVNDASWTGRHKTHYNYSTMPTTYNETLADLSNATKYRFNCNHCHDTDSTKHSLKPASADSAARVFFGLSSATPVASSKRGTYVAGTPNSATDNGFKFTAGSCNTSYCHSNGRGGAPKQAFLNWTTRPTAGSNCTFCHDGKSTTSTASTLSPKHDRHMNPATNGMIGLGNGFNCVDCHAPVITNTTNLTIANKAKHVNATLNYSGARAFKTGYTVGSGNCTTYCHSNGNPNSSNTPVFVSMTGSKIWSGTTYTITTCNKCHGRSNSLGYPDYANGGANNVNSNLHSGHLAGMSDTRACADCHRKTVDPTVINQFRPYSTQHLSGARDVKFDTTKAYVGTKATAATVGNQVTCSNVVCHGQGAPVWGTTTTANQCQKCHGSKATAFATFSSPQVAPGYGSDGTDTSMVNKLPTDARVGAHQRHLTSSAISAPIKCGECHVPVTNIRSANHWNYSTATLTFSGRAVQNGHTPTTSRTNGVLQCSNVNCHSGKYDSGSNRAPFWNMTGYLKETATTVDACTKCHAMPPSGYSNHPPLMNNFSTMGTVYRKCGTCHTTISSSATNVSNVFVNKATHIDGTIQQSTPCNGCHDYDTTGGGTAWGKTNYGGLNQGSGAHAKHIEYLKAKTGYTLNPNGDTYGGTVFNAICGVCHSTSGSDHYMDQSVNTRNITLTGRGFSSANGTYNGNSATSSSVNPKSCSNTDCHYRTSPIWSTY